ncbi:MAG TPA: SpoIIE family protein phosphatase [Oligoflexus sp.]|uniref:SpoIIE family protein phosphatase n=1 Tax=Oligoflexus sp. TaxID=1971216 RepID=UPI002D4ACEBC|nr:SpoIIE family protein phosphatase [Oligoflexus sp.]HYX31982.1 SpoIIE family protein phosphatase [Oligoflexus sp.]
MNGIRTKIFQLGLVFISFFLQLPELSADITGPSFILGEKTKGESLTPFLAILYGVPSEWGPDTVQEHFQKGAYYRETGESVNFGLDFSTKWVHFQLTNPFPGDRSILIENNTTIIDHMELFQNQGDRFVSLSVQGDQEPISQRAVLSRQPVFRLTVPPGTHNYLIRMDAKNVVQLGLKIWDEHVFHQKNTTELMTISLLLGFHIVIALYNFFLYVSVRDRMYLIYVAYVLSNVAYQSSSMGIMQYVNHILFGWETLNNWVMIASVDAVIITALIFSHFLLSLNDQLPMMSRAMKACGLISCLNLLINFTISVQTAAVFCLFNSVLAVTLLMCAGLYLCWKRYKPAYFFTLAWSFYLTGASGNIFSLIGLIPAFEISNWIQLYGGSIEIVLLSLAVGGRMSHIQTKLTRVLTEQKQIEEVVRSAQFLRRRELETGLPDFLNYTYYSQAAKNVSGDWVGMVICPEAKRLYIYLGDVMGHGLSPALMSVIAAGATRGAIHNSLDRSLGEPDRVLHIVRSINDALFDRCHEADCFMSLALVSLNWETGEACHVNAGHTPLLKVTHDEVQSFIQPGSLIGMFKDPIFRAQTLTLNPGESIFLYTDGLTENTSPKGRPLRMRAIHKALLAGDTLESSESTLIQLMNRHWTEQPLADDTTFFILRLEKLRKLASAG